MPEFLREAFRHRAAEIVGEARRNRPEPMKGRDRFSIDELFAKPERERQSAPTGEEELRAEFWDSLPATEECTIEDLLAKPAEEYEKWKSRRVKPEIGRLPETTISETGGVWRKGIAALLKMSTIAPWMDAAAMSGRLIGFPFPRLEGRLIEYRRQLDGWTKHLASRIGQLADIGRASWGNLNDGNSARRTANAEMRNRRPIGQDE